MISLDEKEKEDPYLIFESLNFKGVPLSQADLVRNYLLMCFKHSISPGGEQERIHSKYWGPLENGLKSDDLTEFLRHYIMKDGIDVKKNGIYTAIKKKLKSMKKEEVETEVSSLQRFGEFYARFLSPELEQTVSIRNCLENIKELKVTTAYPLLLRLFDAYQNGHLSEPELVKCLVLIESFIVRRAICGVPTNSLNKLFTQWSKNFPQINHVQWLHTSLSSDTSRFPKDTEFAEGGTRWLEILPNKDYNNISLKKIGLSSF